MKINKKIRAACTKVVKFRKSLLFVSNWFGEALCYVVYKIEKPKK